MADYHCHDCERVFAVTVANDEGTYEFRDCPRCGSAKTTLATDGSGTDDG